MSNFRRRILETLDLGEGYRGFIYSTGAYQVYDQTPRAIESSQHRAPWKGKSKFDEVPEGAHLFTIARLPENSPESHYRELAEGVKELLAHPARAIQTHSYPSTHLNIDLPHTHHKRYHQVMASPLQAHQKVLALATVTAFNFQLEDEAFDHMLSLAPDLDSVEPGTLPWINAAPYYLTPLWQPLVEGKYRTLPYVARFHSAESQELFYRLHQFFSLEESDLTLGQFLENPPPLESLNFSLSPSFLELMSTRLVLTERLKPIMDFRLHNARRMFVHCLNPDTTVLQQWLVERLPTMDPLAVECGVTSIEEVVKGAASVLTEAEHRELKSYLASNRESVLQYISGLEPTPRFALLALIVEIGFSRTEGLIREVGKGEGLPAARQFGYTFRESAKARELLNLRDPFYGEIPVAWSLAHLGLGY